MIMPVRLFLLACLQTLEMHVTIFPHLITMADERGSGAHRQRYTELYGRSVSRLHAEEQTATQRPPPSLSLCSPLPSCPTQHCSSLPLPPAALPSCSSISCICPPLIILRERQRGREADRPRAHHQCARACVCSW